MTGSAGRTFKTAYMVKGNGSRGDPETLFRRDANTFRQLDASIDFQLQKQSSFLPARRLGGDKGNGENGS